MGQPERKRDEERRALLRAMGVASACGLDIALSVLIGVLAGLFADDHLRSAPWGLLVGLLAGLVAGLYTAYLIIAPILRSL
jgi:F0F1-type ATP synthase assembly protein I